MNKKVGIRFKTGGKVYDFSCGVFVLNAGDQVIVETEKGLGFGTVETAPEEVEETEIPGKPMKKVFRKANEKDLKQVEHNLALEREAHAFCMKNIKDLGLKMNLFTVESTFDASRLTFFFTADGRVDFRQLVKILVKQFKVRIEMRQVGIRNQAKMCGGLGRCGRMFCCSSFMEKFEPVSIRMAKQQGLSLNPTKISGQCGRLMCCLTFENDTYRKLKQDFPKIGKVVATKNGPGKVTRHNVICNRLMVRLEEGGEVEINLDDIISDRS
ncbi:stage 0 sporulation family protein [Desulfosarcina sp.]|uniref:PSP1 domain-containing protein n=1 Tax=Desulfosarcina sp. TaxID=2027861 RepID=UPI003970E8A3